MAIEKKFASSDLSNFRQDTFDHVVKELYRHQNFKFSVVIKRINRCGLKESSLRCYHSALNVYLRENKKRAFASRRFYEIIDELRNTCCEVLTPSEQDKRVQYAQIKYKKPTEKVEKPTDTFGVKLEGVIKIFGQEAECDGYMACYKEFVGQDIQKVIVDYKTC